MQKLEIIGKNYLGHWEHTRTACRGIVRRGGEILLSYETRTGQYMIPGGGLEDGEGARACCAREVAEETGALVSVGDCVLEMEEYYGDWKYVSLYFPCEVTGTTEQRLTQREREEGMVPRWLPVEQAVEAFSHHADWAATDEMRRGLYLREYSALVRLFGADGRGGDAK